MNHNSLQIKKICLDIWFNIYAKLLWFFQWLSWYPITLKIRKKYTADIMNSFTAPRWQMIWGCFRSFALHRIRVLTYLMMDTHKCIAIGRNCLLFRTTRVHLRFIGNSCCSCTFVIFFLLYRLVVVGLFLWFGLYFVLGYCLLIFPSDVNVCFFLITKVSMVLFY